MKTEITIGTRGSQLALWQANHVADLLRGNFPNLKIDLKIIKTKGDLILDRSLIGLGKALFTKEIEIALLKNEIDLAVHSIKDLPTDLPNGLKIGAVTKRADCRDVLISKTDVKLDRLPRNAKIGTGSPRRKAQLLNLRSDLKIVDLRGNIDTRLRKLCETDLDAIVLAAAGIERLFGTEIVTQFFDRTEMIPAVGQGALGIEIREDGREVQNSISLIRCEKSEIEVLAERSALREIGGGCQMPIGINADFSDGKLSMIGVILDQSGKNRIFAREIFDEIDPDRNGSIFAKKLSSR